MTNKTEMAAVDILGPEEKKLTALIDADVHKGIKTLAAASGKSMKELVMESYHQYMKPKYGNGAA
tara:strand:- start:200 stop:394 length:195 start_codon:yes stop_codon:yes gene_type:complete